MSVTPFFLTSYDLARGNVFENYEGNLSLTAPKPGSSDIWPGYYEAKPDIIVPPSRRRDLARNRLRSTVYRDDDGDSRRFYEANTDLICPGQAMSQPSYIE